ncbi:hypothetical protein [Afipia felis]|uniref:Uncharacterized protein n=2 Tax=Afipia felis TaxID=1035 RepID=A0A380WBQ8_AFIFE|nr:hypothetical protein [Afipia felis]EKS29658.1 hypothetical protein HMPREF9697_02186 [Afipia felis ATCC 53690]SUU78365.1 Uncharacterised protein [Afipia felis]SUU86430.1 Uncharacterised protein [Afipia felis]
MIAFARCDIADCWLNSPNTEINHHLIKEAGRASLTTGICSNRNSYRMIVKSNDVASSGVSFINDRMSSLSPRRPESDTHESPAPFSLPAAVESGPEVSAKLPAHLDPHIATVLAAVALIHF